MHDLRGILDEGKGSFFLNDVDPKIKIFALCGFLILNLFARSLLLPSALLIFAVGLLAASGIPRRNLLRRLFVPAGIAFMVLLTQLFWMGGEHPLFDLTAAGMHFVATTEGLHRGGIIALQVLSGVCLILLLTRTTPSHRLMEGIRWFRCPETLIEVGLLMFRYIFLLFEEGGRIREAQRVRLGYGTKREALRSASVLGGILFIRAYDRAERLTESMRCRGGSGGGVQVRRIQTGPLLPQFLGAVLVLVGFFFLR